MSCWRSAIPAAAWTSIPGAIFEPFFTTKGPGKGTGPRPGDRVRHRQAERRRISRSTAKSARARLQNLFAARPERGAHGSNSRTQNPPRRHGNDLAGRGRRRSPHACPLCCRSTVTACLTPPTAARRQRSARVTPADRSDDHRRRDAAFQRPSVGGASGIPPTNDEGPVHVRLHRRRHRPSRRSESGMPFLQKPFARQPSPAR